MKFRQKLQHRWKHSNSLLCVGLDPDWDRIPVHLKEHSNTIFHFCRAIIDSTADLVCAFKPQIAYFSALGAEDQLLKVIEYIRSEYSDIPIILDTKRGDIGSTARMYAKEAFERFAADAVTVNPYMGQDSAQPFLDYGDRGVVFLCRTSNSGASDFQDLDVGGKPLYEYVAKKIVNDWNQHDNCCMVVGATWPEQMKRLREIANDMPFLVPGVGAQGGDVRALVEAGQTSAGTGLIINSSRSVLYASSEINFADAAREIASQTKEKINQYRR